MTLIVRYIQILEAIKYDKKKVILIIEILSLNFTLLSSILFKNTKMIRQIHLNRRIESFLKNKKFYDYIKQILKFLN